MHLEPVDLMTFFYYLLEEVNLSKWDDEGKDGKDG